MCCVPPLECYPTTMPPSLSHRLSFPSLFLQPARQGLRLLSHLAAPDTRWYRFDPESRIALLGFGPGGARLQPLQFLPAGPARLPMLDLGPPWVSSPVRGSGEDPMPRAGACAAHVWLVTLYGQVHCAHHDPPQRSLRLFRMYRDASSLAAEYRLPGGGGPVALSVVDNLLAVHLLAAHVTLLYDVAAPGAEPLCAPLPIGGARLAPGGGVAGGDGGAGGGGGVDDGDGGAPRQEDGPQAADRGLDGRALVPGTHSGGVQGGTALADAAQECGEGYAPDSAEGLAVPHEHDGTPSPAASWDGSEPGTPGQSPPRGGAPGPALSALQLYLPDWALDVERGAVYRLTLDLAAMAAMGSAWDLPALLAFLQRRHSGGAGARDARRITLAIMRVGRGARG